MERPEVVDPLKEEEQQPIFRQTPVEEPKPIDTQTEDAFSVRGLAEKRLGKVGTGALDFVPIAGDILAAGDVVESYKKGDVLGTAINSAAFAVGLIPVVGDVAAKGLKAGLKATRAEKSDVPDIWSYPEQMYSSSGTSQNQIAAGYNELKRRGELKKGDKVVDIGGGRFDNLINDASKEGIDVKVFDPFNRTPEHNAAVADAVREGQADVAMSHNVLNVIKEDANIKTVIQQAENAVKPGGKAHFTVYEGNRSGVGGTTKAKTKTQTDQSFQRNQKTVDYVPFVEEVFGAGNVTRKGKIITAVKPIEKAQEKLKKFKSTKGTIFKRGGKFGGLDFPVGKVIGGNQVYFHKNYIGSQPKEVQDLYNSALEKLPPDHNFNTLMYMKGKGDTPDTIRFDESADFDTAREPTPGKMIAVDANGNVAERSSNQIFHHKWMWVGDDYKGFDVSKEYNWSKQWTSKVDNFSGIGKKENWNNILKEKGLELDAPKLNIKVEPPTKDKDGIITYTGSKEKDIVKFRLDKVGTGMGGNWFGSGIYATEEALAKALGTKKGGATYKLFLKNTNDKNLIDYDAPFEQQPEKVKEIFSDLARTSETEIDINELKGLTGGEAYHRLAQDDFFYERAKTYDPPDMAQPSEYIPYMEDHPTYKHYYQEPLFRDGYESLDRPDRLVKEAELSKFLHQEGIKGIKYKKGEIRDIPEEDSYRGGELAYEAGKQNYVIFDPKTIEILAKYGIIGGVTLTALAKGQQEKTTEGISAARGGAIRTYKEGGVVPMQEQMKFAFMSEGGVLADDGVERDPVSGNEVPAGSMAEEVRDDVPAMLSEGEYVVPADVVRYHGIDKFEELRDEAKMGLARMEADGRIGGQPVEEQEEFPFPVEELEGFNEGGAVGDTYSSVTGSEFKANQPYGAGGGRFPGVGFELRNFTDPNTGRTVVIPFFNGRPMQYIPPNFLEGGAPTTGGGTFDPAADERSRQEDEAEAVRQRNLQSGIVMAQPSDHEKFVGKNYSQYNKDDWANYIKNADSKTADVTSKIPVVGFLQRMSERAARSFAEKALRSGVNPATEQPLTSEEKMTLQRVLMVAPNTSMTEALINAVTGKGETIQGVPLFEQKGFETDLLPDVSSFKEQGTTRPSERPQTLGVPFTPPTETEESEQYYGPQGEFQNKIEPQTVADEAQEIIEYAWVVVPGVNANKKFRVDKRDLHLVGASPKDSARAILATDKHGILDPVLRKTTGKGNLIQVHSEGPEGAKVLSRQDLARYSGADVGADASEVQDIIETNANKVDKNKKSIIDSFLNAFDMSAGAAVPTQGTVLSGTGVTAPVSLITNALSDMGLDRNKVNYAAILSKVGYESRGNGKDFTKLSEDLTYRTGGKNYKNVEDRLRAIFPTKLGKLSDKQIQDLNIINNPKNFGNYIYDGVNGNTEVGDGYKYRGRSYVMLTGRENYRNVGNKLGVDLENMSEQQLNKWFSNKQNSANATAAFFAIENDKGKDLTSMASINKVVGGANQNVKLNPNYVLTKPSETGTAIAEPRDVSQFYGQRFDPSKIGTDPSIDKTKEYLQPYTDDMSARAIDEIKESPPGDPYAPIEGRGSGIIYDFMTSPAYKNLKTPEDIAPLYGRGFTPEQLGVDPLRADIQNRLAKSREPKPATMFRGLGAEYDRAKEQANLATLQKGIQQTGQIQPPSLEQQMAGLTGTVQPSVAFGSAPTIGELGQFTGTSGTLPQVGPTAPQPVAPFTPLGRPSDIAKLMPSTADIEAQKAAEARKAREEQEKRIYQETQERVAKQMREAKAEEDKKASAVKARAAEDAKRREKQEADRDKFDSQGNFIQQSTDDFARDVYAKNVASGYYEQSPFYGTADPLGRYDSGSDDSDSGGGDTGGGSVGGGDTGGSDKSIVCTEIYRQTQLSDWSKAMRVWDTYQRRYLTPEHEIGYHWLFRPYVSGMKKSNLLTRFGALMAGRRTQHLKHVLTKGKAKDDLFGNVFCKIIHPTVYMAGKIKNFLDGKTKAT